MMPDPAHDEPSAEASARPRAGRRVRGRTLAERQEQRREAMLAAGLDLFGTKGYAATTVEEVCRRAYISSRNFYEEFDNRLELLVAVGERIVAAAFAAWTSLGTPGALSPTAAAEGERERAARAGDEYDVAVGRLRARVAALVHTLVDDPRVARVAFVETVGIDPAHEALRREMLSVFPAWLEAYLGGHLAARGVPASRRRSLAVGLFGAGQELMSDWALQDPATRPPVDELIDAIVDLGAVVLQLPHSGRSA